MSDPLSRRRFIQSAAAAAATASVASSLFAQEQRPKHRRANPNPLPSKPNPKYADVRVAFVGVGGRGAGNLQEASGDGCTVAALCDVDSNMLGGALKKHPDARTFNDFRKMLDAMHKDIDAVLVAVPDHSHANIALAAMQLGKAVYCEKPLTHDIWEARQLTLAARKYKVATQMGNQHHCKDTLRSQVETIKSGAIGHVSEVYVWTDRPIWPQGINRPADKPPVPDTLNWDTWLGPAPVRPYNPAYHPFKWRGFWDFGTGALGDMGCHLIDPPFWALDLRNPISVEAVSFGQTDETGPKRSAVTYHFPATNARPAVKMTWYDGGMLPPREITDDEPLPDKKNGVLYVGEKGVLFAPTGGACKAVGPNAANTPATAPTQFLPRSPGHHKEWFEAILSNNEKPAMSNFDYAGPLTEVVLLGNLAVRAKKKVVWNADKMEAINAPECDEYIRRERRKGWDLKI